LYVESSGMLAILLDEPTAAGIRAVLDRDALWLSARHSIVEVRRNLARVLDPDDAAAKRVEFTAYWERTQVIELDAEVCTSAAELAERTGLRTLDALHLAAAQRGGAAGIVMLTLDRRLWLAARSIGMATSDVAGFVADTGASV
jgi:predicted nucleic acid-binding protein